MKHFRLTALLLLCLIATVAVAQDRLLTPEDLFRYKRVGGPSLSPDGKHIAFTINVPDLEANRSKTDIWIMKADGTDLWQLTNGASSSYGQVWAPDSEHIAFLRAGQPWLISIRGGEAKQITEIPSGAGGLKWSPDGTKLLFTSMVCPECGLECTCTDQTPATMNKSSAKITDDLLYRHWDTWRTDGKRSHLFILNVTDGSAKDLTPGAEFDVPPFPFGGDGDYAFSPDGKEIAFAAKLAPNPAIHTNIDIHIVPAEGGEIKTITGELKGEETHPLYSPDGKYLSFAVRERAGFEADQVEIYLMDRVSGGMKSLTADYDRTVNEWIWSPDAKTIYFVGTEAGNRPICSISLADKQVSTIADSGYNMGLNLSADGKQLYYAYRDLSTTPTIYTVGTAGGETTELTSVNKEFFADIKMGEVENYWFTGANNDKIQVWIVKPPNFDASKKYPLLHIIHGGPQQDYANLWTTGWNSQVFAAHGYVVALVCFHSTPGYGQDFVDAVSKNWGGWPYEDIMKATDYLISLGFIDEERMAAGGGSYGGYMTNWIATQTDRFKALVTHAGLFNLYSMMGATEELWFAEWELGGTYWEDDTLYKKWSPHMYANNLKTPMLVTHGQQDFRVPVSQGMELFTALRRQGVPARFIYYPDENHWILQSHNNLLWYTEFIKFLDTYVGDPGPK